LRDPALKNVDLASTGIVARPEQRLFRHDERLYGVFSRSIFQLGRYRNLNQAVAFGYEASHPGAYFVELLGYYLQACLRLRGIEAHEQIAAAHFLPFVRGNLRDYPAGRMPNRLDVGLNDKISRRDSSTGSGTNVAQPPIEMPAILRVDADDFSAGIRRARTNVMADRGELWCGTLPVKVPTHLCSGDVDV
jgi:hypothetical protein